MKHKITLSELHKKISYSIKENFSDRYFIVAEINELNESRGHAYIELIEKDEEENLIAKARATIWARTFRMLKPYFESATGHKFESGIKVLLVVTVEFHEVYGYSLNVKDIDPNYTIGDIERKRLLIIQRLEEEGVVDMNKELDISIVPQKIAVISSENAAGYGDFINQLENNDYGFKFYTKLFSASMQGEDTEKSVINALEQIYEFEDFFDVVVIIRGGGSKSDLAWFDSYEMALNISQFSLPILCGIGHEKDNSIIDLVAHTSLKTPTAVAIFITDIVAEYYNYLIQLTDEFNLKTKNILEENKAKLNLILSNFKPLVNEIILKKTSEIELLKYNLKSIVSSKVQEQKFFLQKIPVNIKNKISINISDKKQKLYIVRMNFNNKVKQNILYQKHKLQVFEQKKDLLNPDKILERGFSINLLNNKIIKSIKDVKSGDIIETKLIDGSFKSKVEN